MIHRFVREVRRSLTFEGQLETGARAAYRKMVELDKNIVVASFDGAPEDMLMVFAKGERAAEARAALQPLYDEPLPPLS